MHAVGIADAQYLWMAKTVLFDRRRIRQNVQRIDGNYRLEKYGTGRYEKCANCMVHCGYEPTAAEDAFARPWKMAILGARGPKTEGEIVAVDLSKQRPAEFVFSKHVEETLAKIHADKPAS